MKHMKLNQMLFVPSKSRFELSLANYGSERAARDVFSSRVWNNIRTSHFKQKENINKIIQKFGHDQVIDRALLTMEAIEEHQYFVFLGGDDHFTYCAQNILQYMKEFKSNDDPNDKNLKNKKFVLGTVLDPAKSTGAILYFNVDKLIQNFPKLQQQEYFVEKWTSLEAKVRNGKSIVEPYPAVGTFFIGEYGRPFMSRNIAYINGEELFPDKSSGILVACGVGTTHGSWYDNVHQTMFGEPNVIDKEANEGRIILTEHRSKSKTTLYPCQKLVIDSYNDDQGILWPDSHRDHGVDFSIGSEAEIKISDLKLNVIRMH